GQPAQRLFPLHPRRGAGGRHRGRVSRRRPARGLARGYPARSRGGSGAVSFAASVITLFPELFPGPLGASVIGRGLETGAWSLTTHFLRDFATDRHRTVDDTPAGGGAGMVLKPDIVAAAL